MSKRLMRYAAAGVVAAGLAACGGGGGGGGGGIGGGGTPDPQGGFSGTVERTDGPNANVDVDFDLLVLNDGTYFGFVGNYDPGAPDVEITAMIQGEGTVSGTVFTATDGLEFDFGDFDLGSGPDAAPYAARVDHAVSESSSAIGAADGGVGRRLFYNATFDAAYNTPVPLTDIDGSYAGFTRRLSGDAAITATLASDGSLSATSGACSITGSLAQRPGGKRVFDLQFTYAGGGCATAGQSFTGVAFNSSPTNLILAGVLPNRSDALFAVLVLVP